MNMEEGLWVYTGRLPKMLTTPPPGPPPGPIRSHLKVVTKTEALSDGGGGALELLLASSVMNYGDVHQKKASGMF